jgi:hypothetical protein
MILLEDNGCVTIKWRAQVFLCVFQSEDLSYSGRRSVEFVIPFMYKGCAMYKQKQRDGTIRVFFY